MSETINHSQNGNAILNGHNSEHNLSREGTRTSDSGKRVRGRIPRGAWGYVLGLYDQANETLKMIGDRYGVEPSAVHYVLRQARKKNIQPTLTPPSADLMATPRRLIDGHGDRIEAQAAPATADSNVAGVIHSAQSATHNASGTASVKPAADNAMARAINSPLAKRVMDTSAELINSILHFEETPSQGNRQQLDEARRSGLRAMAAIELWMHQVTATAQSKQEQQTTANDYQPHHAEERLSEMA